MPFEPSPRCESSSPVRISAHENKQTDRQTDKTKTKNKEGRIGQSSINSKSSVAEAPGTGNSPTRPRPQPAAWEGAVSQNS